MSAVIDRGMLMTSTCTEQFQFEVGDPNRYLTSDVTADFGAVHFRRAGSDRVAIEGATGRVRPSQLKSTLGFRDGFSNGAVWGRDSSNYPVPRRTGRRRLHFALQTEDTHTVLSSSPGARTTGPTVFHRPPSWPRHEQPMTLNSTSLLMSQNEITGPIVSTDDDHRNVIAAIVADIYTSTGWVEHAHSTT